MRGLLRRYRDNRVLKELKRMEQLGEVIKCPFCERYRLPEDDCFCNEGS